MYGEFVCVDGETEYEGLTRLPASRKQYSFFPKLGEKDFSDLLGPLKRYLRSSCGRSWNDVYSEICRAIGRTGGWGIRHILSAHLNVAINTYRAVDGNTYNCGKRGIEKIGDGWSFEFYVEPETGLLRYTPRKRVRYTEWRKHNPNVVQISPGRDYRRIKDIWYYVEFTLIACDTGAGSKILREIVTTKKQLNHRELRNNKLQNMV
jgi:hypothetical protein